MLSFTIAIQYIVNLLDIKKVSSNFSSVKVVKRVGNLIWFYRGHGITLASKGHMMFTDFLTFLRNE